MAMTKGTQTALWILSAAALGTGIFFAIRSILKSTEKDDKDKKTDEQKAADVAQAAAIAAALKDTVGANETTTQTLLPSDKLPFKIDKGSGQGGSQGLGVGQLQLMANYLWGSSISVDGKMGSQTKDILNKNLPDALYTCNKVTAYLSSTACDVDKKVWDFMIGSIVKKAPAQKFITYMNSSTDFQNLKKKYKL